MHWNEEDTGMGKLLNECVQSVGRTVTALVAVMLLTLVGLLGKFMWDTSAYDLPIAPNTNAGQAAQELAPCGQHVVQVLEQLERHRLLASTPNYEQLIKETCK